MVTTFQPTTASAAVEGLPQVFDPAAAAGVEAVILFDLSGREPGQWTVVLHDGTCRVMHGRTMERSEEHTSELQSQSNLVCRLLLEKKKKWKEKAEGSA